MSFTAKIPPQRDSATRGAESRPPSKKLLIASKWLNARPSSLKALRKPDRITSYNVCYTKLLREASRVVRPAAEDLLGAAG